METILIVLIVLFLVGGGGYGYRRVRSQNSLVFLTYSEEL
jgi:hypothetical protein